MENWESRPKRFFSAIDWLFKYGYSIGSYTALNELGEHKIIATASQKDFYASIRSLLPSPSLYRLLTPSIIFSSVFSLSHCVTPAVSGLGFNGSLDLVGSLWWKYSTTFQNDWSGSKLHWDDRWEKYALIYTFSLFPWNVKQWLLLTHRNTHLAYNVKEIDKLETTNLNG